MQPQDYVAVKSFARSLLAELQSPPSHNDRPHAGGLVAAAKPESDEIDAPGLRFVDLIAAKRRQREAWGMSPRIDTELASQPRSGDTFPGPNVSPLPRLGQRFRIHSRGSAPLAIAFRRSAAIKSTNRKPGHYNAEDCRVGPASLSERGPTVMCFPADYGGPALATRSCPPYGKRVEP